MLAPYHSGISPFLMSFGPERSSSLRDSRWYSRSMAPEVPMRLPYRELPGLVSERAMSEHYQLYLGYVDNLNGVADPCGRSRAFFTGAVRLHEVFFSMLSPKPGEIGDEKNITVVRAIVRTGGSHNFWPRVKQLAMCSRGWVVVSVDGKGGIHTVSLDSHDPTGLVGEPLIAVDCYEHAYWMNFGGKRAEYLDRLPAALDWSFLDARYKRLAGIR